MNHKQAEFAVSDPADIPARRVRDGVDDMTWGGVTPSQVAIAVACDEIKSMLLEKNRKYGNSALDPLRIFSRADPVEQINVRIDDKLSRIRNRQDDDDEDAELDLIGYLILKRVAQAI